MGQAKSCYPRENSLHPYSIFDDASVNFSSSFLVQIRHIQTTLHVLGGCKEAWVFLQILEIIQIQKAVGNKITMLKRTLISFTLLAKRVPESSNTGLAKPGTGTTEQPGINLERIYIKYLFK